MDNWEDLRKYIWERCEADRESFKICRKLFKFIFI